MTSRDDEILKAVDYDNMAYCTSKSILETSDGVFKEATYDGIYACACIEVVKNFTGPTIRTVAGAGVFKIHSGTMAIEKVDFETFSAKASVEASNTHVGANATAILAGGSASIFDLQLGVGVSSEAGIKDDSVALKAAGCGFKIGRKVGISVFDNEFAIDFGRLFN